MRQIILDTETTGLDPLKGHRLTEIGCLEMVDRRLTGRRFQTYLNPERELDSDAARITGLSTEFLQDKPKFSEISHGFLAFLQEEPSELIIHNAPFDLGFLNCELGLLKSPWQPLENHWSVIDTLVLARRLHPGQRNSLDILCRRYNVDNTHREYHGALLDAELLTHVYLAMTAGQTQMILGTEPQVGSPRVSVTVDKIVRQGMHPLNVIMATDAEYQLHLEKLAKIHKEC